MAEAQEKPGFLASVGGAIIKFIVIPLVAIVAIVFFVPSFYAVYKVKKAEGHYAAAKAGDTDRFGKACSNYLAAYRKHPPTFSKKDIQMAQESCHTGGKIREVSEVMLMEYVEE